MWAVSPFTKYLISTIKNNSYQTLNRLKDRDSSLPMYFQSCSEISINLVKDICCILKKLFTQANDTRATKYSDDKISNVTILI